MAHGKVAIDRSILEDVCKYCENQAIYDKLGSHGDFYYKIKRILNTTIDDSFDNISDSCDDDCSEWPIWFPK